MKKLPLIPLALTAGVAIFLIKKYFDGVVLVKASQVGADLSLSIIRPRADLLQSVARPQFMPTPPPAAVAPVHFSRTPARAAEPPVPPPVLRARALIAKAKHDIASITEAEAAEMKNLASIIGVMGYAYQYERDSLYTLLRIRQVYYSSGYPERGTK